LLPNWRISALSAVKRQQGELLTVFRKGKSKWLDFASQVVREHGSLADRGLSKSVCLAFTHQRRGQSDRRHFAENRISQNPKGWHQAG
jgi:hypothetical protein